MKKQTALLILSALLGAAGLILFLNSPHQTKLIIGAIILSLCLPIVAFLWEERSVGKEIDD